MKLLGWLGMGVGVWLIDSAIHGHANPLRSLSTVAQNSKPPAATTIGNGVTEHG